MIVALIILTGLALMAVVLSKRDSETDIASKQAWERARAGEPSSVGKALIGAGQRVSQSNLVQRESASNAYRSLQRKLLIADIYGSSVEVFLSVQIAALFVAGMMLAGTAFLAGDSGAIPVAAGIVTASAVAALPWNNVSKRAKARQAAVLETLPDFAELLQMSLVSGMGVLPALVFTAERISGPVSDEVLSMTRFIENNPMLEAEAFVMTGERLGTPEAKAFFAALMQSQIDGSRVSATLARQAEALRKKSYERARAEAKKLPVKLVLMMGLHFLPLLFVLALLPVFLSFGNSL